MTDAEIKKNIRRGIKETSVVRVSTSMLTLAVSEGVNVLGMKLKKYAPDSLKIRKTVTSLTHVFDYPSDCDVLQDVWDLGTSAGTITAASNATPIVITEADHGRATDDIVTIHDVLGNTVANGTFKITEVDDDKYSLSGSVGAVNYVSGGKVFKETTAFLLMDRLPDAELTFDDDTRYVLRNNEIIVDEIDFENDLLITYVQAVSGITDVPAKYHFGLVAFGVLNLMEMPEPEEKDFGIKKKSLEFYNTIWGQVDEDIRHGSQISARASGISKMNHI